MTIEKSIRNRRSRAVGAQFEAIISRSCAEYKSAGLAKIEKQPEPMKVIKSLSFGHFEAVFAKKSGVDYKGTLAGGRAIAFEAKHTDSSKITKDRVEPHQLEDLQYHAKMGAVTFILCSFGLEDIYRVPLHVWERMKDMFGHQYVTRTDLEKYRVPHKGGRIQFLEGIVDD